MSTSAAEIPEAEALQEIFEATENLGHLTSEIISRN